MPQFKCLLVIAFLASNLLVNLWAQSLDDMAAPITSPTTFEDPRANTEIRPIYIYHKISDDFVNSGGAANIYALQLRYAIDERLALLATKDGYVDLNSDATLEDENGFADVALGAKYAFYKNDADREILTAGLRYEIPLGDEEVFQGQGDGAFNPFISGAIGVGEFNIMLGTGFRLAVDDSDSSFYDADLHFDTKIGWFHPVLEFNLVHVVNAGDRLPIPDEGEDFFNFGANASEGKTLVSAAVGGRLDLAEKICLGLAYQFPLTNGDGSNLLDWRITSDLIFSF